MVLRAYQWFSGELLVVLSGCPVVVHNVFWWFSITTIVLLNGFKHSMVPNGSRWFSMVTSSSRWFSMVVSQFSVVTSVSQWLPVE